MKNIFTKIQVIRAFSVILLLMLQFIVKAENDPVLDAYYNAAQKELRELTARNAKFLELNQPDSLKLYFGVDQIQRQSAEFDNALLKAINDSLIKISIETGKMCLLHFVHIVDYDCSNINIQPTSPAGITMRPGEASSGFFRSQKEIQYREEKLFSDNKIGNNGNGEAALFYLYIFDCFEDENNYQNKTYFGQVLGNELGNLKNKLATADFAQYDFTNNLQDATFDAISMITRLAIQGHLSPFQYNFPGAQRISMDSYPLDGSDMRIQPTANNYSYTDNSGRIWNDLNEVNTPNLITEVDGNRLIDFAGIPADQQNEILQYLQNEGDFYNLIFTSSNNVDGYNIAAQKFANREFFQEGKDMAVWFHFDVENQILNFDLDVSDQLYNKLDQAHSQGKLTYIDQEQLKEAFFNNLRVEIENPYMVDFLESGNYADFTKAYNYPVKKLRDVIRNLQIPEYAYKPGVEGYCGSPIPAQQITDNFTAGFINSAIQDITGVVDIVISAQLLQNDAETQQQFADMMSGLWQYMKKSPIERNMMNASILQEAWSGIDPTNNPATTTAYNAGQLSQMVVSLFYGGAEFKTLVKAGKAVKSLDKLVDVFAALKKLGLVADLSTPGKVLFKKNGELFVEILNKDGLIKIYKPEIITNFENLPPGTFQHIENFKIKYQFQGTDGKTYLSDLRLIDEGGTPKLHQGEPIDFDALFTKLDNQYIYLTDDLIETLILFDRYEDEFVNLLHKQLTTLTSKYRPKLASDFETLIKRQGNHIDEFVNALDDGLKESWKLLDDAGRTGLKTDINAIQALEDLRKHSKIEQLKNVGKISDADLAKIQGFNIEGSLNKSYAQVCDKLNSMLDNLPAEVENILGLIGGKGLRNADQLTRRHAYMMMETIESNSDFIKTASKIDFEKKITNTNPNIYQPEADFVITKNNVDYIVEVKAGQSNYEHLKNQLDGYLHKVNNLEELRVFDTNFSKETIISIMKDPKGSTTKNLFESDNLLQKFESFRVNKTDYTNEILDTDDLLDFVESNDDWFTVIFNSGL